MTFLATLTAYCVAGITASGVHTYPGVIAVDPAIIPLGSIVEIHDTKYKALDTGPYVQGHHIDIYMTTCQAAEAYGVRRGKVKVLAGK